VEDVEMAVKPIPDGYHAVTPYLVVKDVAKQIEFLEKAFGAETICSMDSPQGIMHAEVKVRDSIIMMGAAKDEYAPREAMFYLYVEDVDSAYKQAVAAGGTVVKEPTDQFYGDRSGAVKDSNGNEWWVASRKEDLTEEQIAERAQKAHASAGSKK
jgi:PhnB protein